MKTRESDMPEEEIWAGFFEPEHALRKLGLDESCGEVVEFGCGYGTFTIPAAKIARGIVHAIDVEPEMVERAAAKAQAENLSNVRTVCRDFTAQGTGLDDSSADYAMLFNILHAQERDEMLREAHRVLRPGGVLAIVHWNYDAATPRGPSMSIRPRPEELRVAAEAAGFAPGGDEPIALPPFHYGWVMRKVE